MIKITDTIYLIQGRNEGRFPYCHCLYIKDDVRALIDSAAGKENLVPVLERVDTLINSHFHPDHIRGNSLFPRARIFCHADDRPAIESNGEMLRYTGYTRFTPEQIAGFMPIIAHKPSKVDETLTDGQIMDFGRTKLRVVHTPGHTPGHCCFFEEKTGLMFGADIDLTPFGPWYAHELSDLEDFQASMDKVLSMPVRRFIGGHEDGDGGNDSRRRLQSYAAVFAERDRRILECLKTPHTLEELADRKLIYPRHPQPAFFFYYFEWQMVKKHLEKLLRQEKIVQIRGKYLVTDAGKMDTQG